MTDPTTMIPSGGAAAPASMSPAAAPQPFAEYSLPTHDAAGAVLNARQQFELIKQNPAFLRDVFTPGTPAFAMRADLDLRMVADREAAETGVVAPTQPRGAAAVGAKAEAFKIPGLDADASAEDRHFDGQARGWLAALGAPLDTGNGLAEHLDRLTGELANLSETDFELRERNTDAAIDRAFGARRDEILGVAAKVLAEVRAKDPAFDAWLGDLPESVIADPMVVSYLYSIGLQRGLRAAP
ncbi:MAG: hypothetical protein IT483_15790 [Gammaproteobacteria bacterium]|nr:hypothetical protein [Gammaproteobacteria bacterium]